MKVVDAERGQAAPLVIGLCLIAFVTSGLAMDGARLLVARHELENAADGASAAVRTRTYSSGARSGSSVASEHRVIEAWLALEGIDADAEITSGSGGAQLILRGRLPTTFLGMLGIGDLTVSATASLAHTTGPMRR